MAKRENKRSAKLTSSSKQAGGQKAWTGVASKGLGEQSAKTIKRGLHS